MLQKKSQYLKKKQDGEIGEKAEGHPQFFAPSALFLIRQLSRPFQKQAAQESDGGGEGHQKRVPGIPAHIEIVACRQQPHPAHPVGQQEVDQRHDRKKDKEIQGIEQHLCSSDPKGCGSRTRIECYYITKSSRRHLFSPSLWLTTCQVGRSGAKMRCSRHLCRTTVR